ncbi:MAG: VOC family protein [Mobilicoccus sp.]|nr:VOC family protein [Mobilicoccus sp.]MDO5629233.1 VOC family protein [Mobilicoccus sp.]
MDQRLNIVTLAVRDLEASRAFYVDGLGWTPELNVPGEVVFVAMGPGLILSLWSREGFIEELGEEPTSGLAPLTLAHNVPTPDGVDEVVDLARAAGAPVMAGQWRDWGGYSAYLSDPDGFRWEVAYNPGPIGQKLLDGTLGAVDAETAQRELRAREPLFHREPRDAGREHIEAMVASGMVHIGASGRRMDREETIAEVARRYRDGDHGDDDTWVVEDFAVEHLGQDVWAATYMLHQGPRVTHRCTLWERHEGRWRVRRHQGTVIDTRG